MKKWYNSRTIRLSMITGIIGIVTAFTAEYPDAEITGILVTALGLLNGILRFDTKTGIE